MLACTHRPEACYKCPCVCERVRAGQRGERCSSTPVHTYTQLRGHLIITAIAHAHDTARNLICFSRSSSGALRTSKCATLFMRASIKPQQKIQIAKFPALVVRRSFTDSVIHTVTMRSLIPELKKANKNIVQLR